MMSGEAEPIEILPGDKLRMVIKEQLDGLGTIMVTQIRRGHRSVWCDAVFCGDPGSVFVDEFAERFADIWSNYPHWFRAAYPELPDLAPQVRALFLAERARARNQAVSEPVPVGYARAADHLHAEGGAPAWQEIKTAPRFRTNVLLWGPECGTQIGHYDESAGCWAVPRPIEPTYWMQLPPRPHGGRIGRLT